MTVDAEMLQAAIEFSVISHRGQIRKGNKRPYILHPISVMTRLMQIKENSVNIYLLACAAVLHDVVEDCGINIEEIIRRFGLKVATLVEELTTDKKMVEILGKTQYLSMKMISMSSYAFTIKLVDRLDNISDMKSNNLEFINKQCYETREILKNVVLNRDKITDTQHLLIKQIDSVLRSYEATLNNE